MDVPSQTVDFGIDLGTTNSAIARTTSSGVKIIKNRTQSDTTPSAVARTRAGQTLVGQDALNKPDLSPATKFKRLMGTTNTATLADGSVWTPEALSAEVLKDLKASVQRRFDVQPTHVVVTVPAMFQQPQCEATHRAAESAGLTAVSLLQEPIAAATAYLSESSKDGYYIVYDLGGGTFDVSIVQVRDNTMSIVAHGGDNYLGGSDFDLLISEWAIGQIERKHGKLPELREAVPQYHLLQSCEQAKIRLSDDEQTIIDLSDLDLPVTQLPLTRAAYEAMISEIVARTIRLSRDRLDQAELRPRDIISAMLVGGPTMTPYVRRIIREQLGVPVSVDQDPMTVVAIGASIAASSILVTDRVAVGQEPSQSVVLALYYEPISPDPACSIAGKVTQPEGFTGEVRLVRSDDAWDSGWLALRGGAFQCDLLLKSGAASTFQISLRDLKGRAVPVAPPSVTLRHGLAPAASVVPYDYGVALADGIFGKIISQNQPLPAVGTVLDFRTVRTISAGTVESLPIYFLEGTSSNAGDNVCVGRVDIRGQDLPRTLREGERIDIRIRMDESRRIVAHVLVPLLDLEYKVPLTSVIDKPNEEDLWLSLGESMRLAREMQPFVSAEDEQKLQQCFCDVERLEAEMQLVQKGQVGAGERVVQKLMPVKASLRELSGRYVLNVAWNKAIGMIDMAEKVCSGLDARMGVAQAQDLRAEALRQKTIGDERGLNAVFERADELYWEYYVKMPECWIGFVEDLKHDRTFAVEQLPYDEYLKRAEDCLLRQDYEGVRLNGVRALNYLPESHANVGRYSNAGISR